MTDRVLYGQNLEIEGEANLCSSVQIAQLALKHRQNKNQRQRIVIFMGSPLSEDKVRCFLTCRSVNVKDSPSSLRPCQNRRLFQRSGHRVTVNKCCTG